MRLIGIACRPPIIIALLLALLVLITPAAPAPAIAQPPAPTAMAPTLTPTPSNAELIGVGPQAERGQQLVERFGWLGALGALVVIAAILLLGSLGKGFLAAFQKRGEKYGNKRFEQLDRREVEQQQAHALETGIAAYLDWLRAEYGRTQPLGISTEQVQLDLSSVHVPLRVLERSAVEQYQKLMRGEAPDGEFHLERERFARGDDARIFTLLSDPELLPQRRDKDDRASEVAPATTTRLLLLGDAGSGKTTTLRYAALCMASAYRDGRADRLVDPDQGLGLYLRKPLLPIYVRLTLFAATLPADLNALAPQERQAYTGAPPALFLSWLDDEAAKVCAAPAGTLVSHITRGQALLLLDGLDEAGDLDRRAYLAQLIANLASKYPGNRYVVASRTAGYGGRVYLDDTFLERHLSPLDAEEAQAVIRKWFAAVDVRLAAIGRARRDENAEAQTARLWGVIERNDRLFEMATNPLLATAMALLQFNNVRLPDQRAKLYEKLVELLLDLWRKQQLANDTLQTSLSVAQLATEQRRVEVLAWNMQQQPQQARDVTLAQAQTWLSPLYMERLGLDREAADRRVRELLDSLALESGLIQRRDDGYSFSHYTFQEYLAARALDGLGNRPGEPDGVTFLLEKSAEARWRETLLLAAGHWSNGQQLPRAERLLRGLLDRRTQPALLLAGNALADIGEVEELTRLRAETVDRLRAIAFDPARYPDPPIRNRAATLLDRLDADERLGLDLEDAAYWATPIPPGPFVMGDDNGEYGDEKPAFTYTIRRPYALARYPVTNRQYLRFLEALEAIGRAEEANRRRPRYWPGRRYRAGEGSHPVVAVSWEDATAFAAWVDQLLREQGVLKEGEEVRLPAEPEWERAALPGRAFRRRQRREPPRVPLGRLAHGDCSSSPQRTAYSPRPPQWERGRG